MPDPAPVTIAIRPLRITSSLTSFCAIEAVPPAIKGDRQADRPESLAHLLVLSWQQIGRELTDVREPASGTGTANAGQAN
jgi:hypothetical protein